MIKRLNSEKEKVKAFPKLKYLLHLYVAGMTPHSLRAIRNIKKICEEYLKDRYELFVIDIYRQPDAVKEHHLLAAPTLIRNRPLPVKRLIGDMADTDKILLSLDLRPKKASV